MLDRERKYPVLDEEPAEESIKSLDKAGFKMVKDAVIMDNGSVLYMLINGKWRPARYD